MRIRLLAMVLLMACGFRSAAAADAPLNLLIITADDMNADSSGGMGSTLGATPNLDAFAATAFRFAQCHVTVPICQPSRSALMTGRVPHRNGALGFNPIRTDVPTLVEMLKSQGYYAAVINKVVAYDARFEVSLGPGLERLGEEARRLAHRLREVPPGRQGSREAVLHQRQHHRPAPALPRLLAAGDADAEGEGEERPAAKKAAAKKKAATKKAQRNEESNASPRPRLPARGGDRAVVPRRHPAGAEGGRAVLHRRGAVRRQLRQDHRGTQGRGACRRYARRVPVGPRDVVPVLEGLGLPQRHLVAGALPPAGPGAAGDGPDQPGQ